VATATKTPNIQSISGNRVQIEFGGQRVGLAQSVRGSDSYALEQASGIGDIHVIENVPTRANHRVSVNNMVLFRGNLRDQGISAINGDDALLGLTLDIVIYSRDSGLALKAYRSCSFDSGTVSVEAHRILSQDAQFIALDTTGTNI
jgi:hypothetical protein